MKLTHLTLVLAIAGALSACNKQEAPTDANATADAKAPALKIDQSKLPALPKFDVADLDSAHPVCTDLNAFVNSKWLAANPVPSDKTTWGSFEMLGERSLAAQKEIVEAAAKAKNSPGSNEQKIGDIYGLGMDEAKLNADGAAPLKPLLAEIDGLKDGAGIAQYLIDGFAKGQQSVFSFFPESDFKDPGMVIAFAFQNGLSLPEKSYYVDPGQKAKRDAFVAHVERMLVLGGVDAASAKTQAAAVLAFESRLAKASVAPIEMRDPNNQYHYVTMEEADKATPNFSWSKLFAAQGIQRAKGFSMSQPKFFAEVDKMLTDVPVADWQAYLRYHTIADSAGFLSDALSNERFDFYGKTMRGQQEQKPRWKRVLDTINGSMGEALGQVYVEQVFPEESKAQMQALVDNLREALKARLEKLEWMSAETKAKALEKWNTFDPKIGYPDKWRDYSGLSIDGSKSYLDNALAAGAFENAYQMAKVGKPADRKEWGMTPQTVNAYYNPLKNEIVFPAAILQPPFFDPSADPALNYGGIGAVIGHEMLHGYDDQGSQFDAQGKQQNWWTDADLKNFKERTGKLVAQFNDYVHVKDEKEGPLHVDGGLTLGENIADLGGLTVAYDALQRDLMNKRMALVDGYTQDQRFFMNWATVWRRNYTHEEAKVRLKTDVHAPAPFRAIGAPSNMASFASAFQCKAGDAMVRGDKNILIW
ncbi:M13 family metallopeptidase [Arenimonas sp.]|uniref:M13 family metallopeptidase n=1 Tax=Arenimonas sp. TaxID=1872635 RepID=UPI0039E72952